jgi:hypothetical protein
MLHNTALSKAADNTYNLRLLNSCVAAWGWRGSLAHQAPSQLVKELAVKMSASVRLVTPKTEAAAAGCHVLEFAMPTCTWTSVVTPARHVAKDCKAKEDPLARSPARECQKVCVFAQLYEAPT